MYCRSLSLLITLIVTVVTGQSDQVCQNASLALLTNAPCHDAIDSINDAIKANRTLTSSGQLNTYCSQDCRAIYGQFLAACSDGGSGSGSGDILGSFDLTQLQCTTDSNGMSCFDVAESPATLTVDVDLLLPVYSACVNELIGGSANQTTCSQGCAMAVQGFVNNVGCCYLESLRIANQITSLEILSLIPPCRADHNFDTCQLIQGDGGTTTDRGNGANALCGISGSVLLIAATIVSVL